MRALVATSVLLASLTFTSTASAVTRYVSPSGGGTTCSEALPCDIKYAVDTASGAPFDVKLLPGTYGSAAVPILNLGANGTGSARSDTVIQAADPAQRPLIHLSTSAANYALIATSGTLNDVDIVMPATATPLYGVFVGEMNRVSVLGRASNGSCIATKVRNSVCANTVGAGFSMSASAGAPVDYAIEFTNVTFWGGPSAYGVDVLAGQDANIDITMRNSIVRGGVKSLNLATNNVGVSDVDLFATHSNFFGADLAGTGATASNCGLSTNQCSAPMLVDAANGDFREAAGSPTIGAGNPALVVGTTDVAGLPRLSNGLVDIGAHQVQQPAQPAPTPVVAPTISSFKLNKKKYKAAKKGKAFQPSANAKKKSNEGRGAVASFSLTGEGSVHFRLFKQVKKNGKKTWKYVKGVETVTGVAGSNKFWFSGRWKGKTLQPGTYLLKGTPTIKGSTIKNTSGDEPGTSKGLSSSIVKK